MTREEMLNKLNGSVNDFFYLLRDMRGASLLNEKLVQFLVDLHCVDSSLINAQKVLHIFFAVACAVCVFETQNEFSAVGARKQVIKKRCSCCSYVQISAR